MKMVKRTISEKTRNPLKMNLKKFLNTKNLIFSIILTEPTIILMQTLWRKLKTKSLISPWNLKGTILK
jgi:hypothetical protein